MYLVFRTRYRSRAWTPRTAPLSSLSVGMAHGEVIMGLVDPARYANERQALHPHFAEYNGPPPPKKRQIRHLVKLLFGRKEKNDR